MIAYVMLNPSSCRFPSLVSWVERESWRPARKEISEAEKSGPHSSPINLMQASCRRNQNDSRHVGPALNRSRWPFRYRGHPGRGYEGGGSSPLVGNVGGAPGGVWIQQTVDRFEPRGGKKEKEINKALEGINRINRN